MQLTTDELKPTPKPQPKKEILKPKKPTLGEILLSAYAMAGYRIVTAIAMFSFMVYGAHTLWFTDVYYYGWTMLGFAVIAAFINSVGSLFITQDDEFSGAVGAVTFIGIIFVFVITAMIKDMSHDHQYKIIKDRNVTEIKWYDKDEIAIDVATEGKIKLDNYYKAKVKFQDRGYCRITTFEGTTWTDGKTSYTDYCYED